MALARDYRVVGFVFEGLMIIYNTTFHIDKSVRDEGLDYLRKIYMPQALASGFLRDPNLRRVLATDDAEGENYCVQFRVKNVDTLNYWMEKEGRALHEALVRRFGEKMVGFSTLLEELDWAL